MKGSANHTATIVSNGTTASSRLTLSGFGFSRELTVSALNIGEVDINHASTSWKTLTLSNTGNRDLQGTDIGHHATKGSFQNSFYMSPNNGATVTIALGTSKTFKVRYSPASDGKGTQTITTTFSTNKTSGTASLNSTVFVNKRQLQVIPTADPINIGHVDGIKLINLLNPQHRASQTITLRNNGGNKPLTVTGINEAGTSTMLSLESTSFPKVIQPNSSVDVIVSGYRSIRKT